MLSQLLTREEFKQKVFERDLYKCVNCGSPAEDAHHIIDRILWGNGGYFLDNGVSLCGVCHIMAEQTYLSCTELRRLSKILNVLLPEHFFFDEEYDKWGNIILPSGMRIKGELFGEENLKKILPVDIQKIFLPYVKYPRTMHLPWSENLQNDDRMHNNVDFFLGREVIGTIKVDGENCFEPSTLIDTKNGKIPIKDLCAQQRKIDIISQNLNTNTTEYQPIEHFLITEERNDWYEIEAEDGTILKVTEDQLIWLPQLQCYRRVRDLKSGDSLLIK